MAKAVVLKRIEHRSINDLVRKPYKGGEITIKYELVEVRGGAGKIFGQECVMEVYQPVVVRQKPIVVEKSIWDLVDKSYTFARQ